MLDIEGYRWQSTHIPLIRTPRSWASLFRSSAIKGFLHHNCSLVLWLPLPLPKAWRAHTRIFSLCQSIHLYLGFPTSTPSAVSGQTVLKRALSWGKGGQDRYNPQIRGLSAERVQSRPVYYQVEWIKCREKRKRNLAKQSAIISVAVSSYTVISTHWLFQASLFWCIYVRFCLEITQDLSFVLFFLPKLTCREFWSGREDERRGVISSCGHFLHEASWFCQPEIVSLSPKFLQQFNSTRVTACQLVVHLHIQTLLFYTMSLLATLIFLCFQPSIHTAKISFVLQWLIILVSQFMSRMVLVIKRTSWWLSESIQDICLVGTDTIALKKVKDCCFV